ncbi:MAG: NosD domain-containing protein [Terrimicrobiaceae bacterium]
MNTCLRCGLALALMLPAFGCAGGAELQEKIDAAAPGDVVTVGPAVYRERIIIRKPLTLVGEGFPAIAGDDAAVFVTGNDATIEANEIEDSLHGVYLKKVSGSRVLNNRIRGKTTLAAADGSIENDLGQSAENCDTGTLVSNRRGNGIHQWNCERNEIAGNEISDTRDGMYFSFTTESRVENNVIHHVRYGLHYMYSDANVFADNTFADNAAGAAIMFSKGLTIRGNRFVENSGMRAYGLIFQSVDETRLENNQITHNAVGLSFNQCNRNQVIGNEITHNYIGLRFGSNSDDNRFSANVFVKNLYPVEVAGETGTNRWSVSGVGNFWEGAQGLDLDTDGVNDLPHRELDLFGVLRRDFPAIALLSESPAVKLLRFAHERAKLPGFQSIEDDAPLMRPPERLASTLPSLALERSDVRKHDPPE